MAKKDPDPTGGGSAVVVLREPVEAGGRRVETLTMRRPLVRDLRAAQRAAGRGALGADVEFRLFVNLCEVEPEVIDGMDLADYLRLQKVYEDFTSPPPTSGAPGPS